MCAQVHKALNHQAGGKSEGRWGRVSVDPLKYAEAGVNRAERESLRWWRVRACECVCARMHAKSGLYLKVYRQEKEPPQEIIHRVAWTVDQAAKNGGGRRQAALFTAP